MLIIEALGNPEYVGTTITDTSSFQTSQFLRDKYVEYNRRFFQGRLPVIPVELLEASRAGSRSAAFDQVPYYCGTTTPFPMNKPQSFIRIGEAELRPIKIWISKTMEITVSDRKCTNSRDVPRLSDSGTSWKRFEELLG